MQRFAVAVSWFPVPGGEDGVEMFGTWQTEAAAEIQANAWRKKIDKQYGQNAPGAPIVWVQPILPKNRARFDARLAHRAGETVR